MEQNLKPIFLNNSYPLKLLNSKFFQFLQHGPKPKPPEVTFTLSLPYTSKNMDFHVKKLVREIKVIMPYFHIRPVYKGIKVSNLFSADAKPKNSDILDTTNCCYHFKCTCSSHYVGMTAYLTKLKIFEEQNLRPNFGSRAKKKIKDKFFMLHFKILQRRFCLYFERRNTEAFFIRILRPDLNDQKDHNSFALFLIWAFFEKIFLAHQTELLIRPLTHFFAN